MTDSKNSLQASSISKGARLRQVDIKRLISQHEGLQQRVDGLRDSLLEKDMLIKSQRNTIKLYELKLANIESNNSTLKHIITLLTNYITQELNEVLPPLPPIPENDDLIRVDPVSLLRHQSNTPAKKNKKHKKLHNSSFESGNALSSFSFAQRQQSVPSGNRSLIFDENLGQHMYQDFSGSEFLKTILDAQLCREEMKKVTKFLLGKTSQDVFLFKTRTILFESVSFFLSLRNVAFQNFGDVFLPRVLEMLSDIFEAEKVTVFLYDEEKSNFYCKAITVEIDQQIIVAKNFGHFAYSWDGPLFINGAYDDSRFDSRYDTITSFITRNLACYPLKLGDQLIGILEIANKRKEFSKDDFPLMAQIAKQLSVGFGAQLVKEKMSELNQKAAISRGHIESSKESLVIPILNEIANSVKALVNCERVTIYLYDDKEIELVSVVATGLEGVIRISTNRGLASIAFTSGKIVNVENAEQHSLFNSEIDAKTGFKTKEVLAVPIGNKGVLQCLNKANLTPFSKSDEMRVSSIASVISVLLESSDNFEGLLLNSDVNELCLQAVREAILHVNSQGLLQKVNRYAAELFKLSPERMTGATISEIFEHSPDLLSKFLEAVKKQNSVTLKNQKLVVSRNSGELKWININVSFVMMGGLEDGGSFVILIQPISA
ncbi:unnamed protein product [Blepharisma stoltei]|uniref:GAF domain-containing protein n=1 Tax=Blepharisma stoltei TaxID=1481888 RepID=A0AAU9K6U1_9CILI|nr:unnamed protein product [Blepharisma stoltei]